MATGEHLKALLKSYLEGDDERFVSVAMQVAAQEARLGHGKLATELRSIIDQAKKGRGPSSAIPIGRPRGDLANLLSVAYPKSRMSDLILDAGLAEQLNRIIVEQRESARILAHGLSPRRKLLLMGPPGTGKTMSAAVLAAELGLPLYQVRLDGLITKFMGETAAKLRQVFDATEHARGVYFFDEFDAIGSQRGQSNDVGEMSRVLNSFLQMIEQDSSHSLIVAATNHPELLDHALFRRFDDVLHYSLPSSSQIAGLLKARLGRMSARGVSWKRLAEKGDGLSYAEIARSCDEVLKDAVIGHRERVDESEIGAVLDERRAIGLKLKRIS